MGPDQLVSGGLRASITASDGGDVDPVVAAVLLRAVMWAREGREADPDALVQLVADAFGMVGSYAGV